MDDGALLSTAKMLMSVSNASVLTFAPDIQVSVLSMKELQQVQVYVLLMLFLSMIMLQTMQASSKSLKLALFKVIFISKNVAKA